MGKKLAVTVGAIHKLAKKAFFTGEDLLHHKVKKAFLTKDGVHRLVYSSGIKWAKYNCEVESGDYYLNSDNSLIGTTHLMKTNIGDEVYGGYEFSPSEGFVGIDPITVESEDDAIGRYIVEPYEVYLIIDMWHTETADMCGQYNDSYSQGSILYGTLEAEEGELPENGVIVDGSPTDKYCVLEINGAYYYYLRNEAEEDAPSEITTNFTTADGSMLITNDKQVFETQ